MRAKRENSSTSCLSPSTSWMMVEVASSSSCFSSGLRSPASRRLRRWAESWIGVSGFLISWAMRWATSRHAARRWAFRSSVRSSNTSTSPMSAPSGPRSAVAEDRRVIACPSRLRCTSCSTVPSLSRVMRLIRAAISPNSGRRKTAESGCPSAACAGMPSMRSAAPLMVVTHPSGSRETTPVATASSTVSV